MREDADRNGERRDEGQPQRILPGCSKRQRNSTRGLTRLEGHQDAAALITQIHATARIQKSKKQAFEEVDNGYVGL